MVKYIDKENTYIGNNVKFGEGVIIHPNVHIQGDCYIGSGTEILPNTVINNSKIGIFCKIGPNAYIRDESEIDTGSTIGFSVEIKNSYIGRFSNIKHLTYIGDTVTGRSVNFGASCVTANYDGNKKHKTYIGDYSFIGSGVILIAPIQLGNKSFVAAGSTISNDLPNNTFVIERSTEKQKENKFKKSIV